MTTTPPTETRPDHTAAQTDAIVALFNEAQTARALLRKRWSARAPSPQEIASELEGTVLSLVLKLIRVSGQTRDAIYGDMEQFHERISDLEEDATQFAPDDAEKFLALCVVVKYLTGMLREVTTLDPAQHQKLDEADQLADQCTEIVHATTLTDDEDDTPAGPDGDPDDDDEDARAERGQ